MADEQPVDPHGIRIEIERGDQLESAELDAALEQLAQALAGLESPEPLQDDDEVQGFAFGRDATAGLKIGDVMGRAPRFDPVGPLSWCLGRCSGNFGDGCGSYCWVEG